jgi:hypothetical protein
MEYGCEVWNGCGVELTDKLEKLEVARVVTGLPAYVSRNSLYLETGWEKLIDRRNRRYICLMYNIVNYSVLSYLTDILPPRIFEITNYPLGNSEKFTNPSYRLTLTNSSFFPSTLRAQNSLDLENRNAPSYTSFKRQLVNKTLVPVPVWYSTGVRKWSIIHTKLRYNYSILNYDLFRFNLKDNPGCACGFECENVFHFFLECLINELIRNTLFLILQIYGAIDIDIILYGKENLTEAQNVDIFTAVQTFIRYSHRFD